MVFEFSQEEENLRRLLFKTCDSMEELHDWVYFFCGVDLPGTHVDPDSNCSPLEMCWEIYDLLLRGAPEGISQALYYASRAGGKTLSESIVEVLLLLHFRGISVVHLASIEEQSKNCQEYLKNFFANPMLAGFVEGDNKRATSTVLYENIGVDTPILNKSEWKTLPVEEQRKYRLVFNKVEVIVATIKSANGKHGALFLDELDIIDSKRVLKQTVNIPTPIRRPDGQRSLPITVMTSTRKTAFGPVQDAINKAEESKLLIRHWNALDVTEACPASRHRPDLPKLTIYRSDELLSAVSEENYNSLTKEEQKKYEKDTGYHGCLRNCSLFAACKGNLATKQTSDSSFLKPIGYQINQFKDCSLDIAQAELLCRKPSSTGLIYPRLGRDRHMLTPAQAYEKIFGEKNFKANLSKSELVDLIISKGEWRGAIDWGYTHIFAYVQGIDINNVMYVTHCFAGVELERSQQMDEMNQFRRYEPLISPDMEDPQAIKEFKKAGFRLKDWKKNAGSVIGGINIVRKKLNPPLGKPPELYFVRDLGEDPFMDLLFLRLQEHHWKLGAAGEITNNVSDNNKDLPDALRYLIMNKYDAKGQFTLANEPEPKQRPVSSDGKSQYLENNWMTQQIANLTGQEPKPPQAERPPMKAQSLNDYYQEQNKEEIKDKEGKSRGIIWDFG